MGKKNHKRNEFSRNLSHRKRALPLHSWETHPLAHKGEANKTFVIVVVAVIAVLALALLLFFSNRFVGQAIYEEKQFAAGLVLPEKITENQPFDMTVRTNIVSNKTVAIAFKLVILNGTTSLCDHVTNVESLLGWNQSTGVVFNETKKCANNYVVFNHSTLNTNYGKSGTFDIAKISLNGLTAGEYIVDFKSFEIVDLESGQDLLINTGSNTSLIVSSTETVCSPEHPDACTTLKGCRTAKGYWYNNRCYKSGECPLGTVQNESTLTCDINKCVPQCSGKSCGDDGCGNICPPGCGSRQECNSSGKCVATALNPCIDADGDGYVAVNNNCDPAGKQPDADDNNASCWINQTLYFDNDRDGFGDAFSIPKTVCTNDTLPPYTSLNKDDCFDTNPQQKTCGEGKKCIAKNTCEQDCEIKCTLGKQYCSGRFVYTCVELNNYCNRWNSHECDPGYSCNSESLTCVSDRYCNKNKDCSGGYCNKGECKDLSPAEGEISVRLIRPDLSGISSTVLPNNNYVVQVQILPLQELGPHYVQVVLAYDMLNQPAQQYWTSGPALYPLEPEVIAFNHFVPNTINGTRTWGHLNVYARVFDLWSSSPEPLFVTEESYALGPE